MAWFVGVWDHLPPAVWHWTLRHLDDGAEYVRCPLCRLRGRRIELHLCSPACAGEAGSVA